MAEKMMASVKKAKVSDVIKELTAQAEQLRAVGREELAKQTEQKIARIKRRAEKVESETST